MKRKSLEPWIPDEIEYYDHQVTGIRHLARMRSFLLADDMGLGKCLESITVFAIDVFRGWAERCIIIAPVLLKGNWVDEIEKFTRFPFIVLQGDSHTRARQLVEFMLMEGPKILIVNYEQVSDHLEQLKALDFHVAIYDESHYMKNPESKRTKACLEFPAHRNFMLSGTPMLNSPDEFWSTFNKIDPVAYDNYFRFRNRYCLFGGHKGKSVIGAKNEKELKERLHGVMLRRLKSEVLDLPPVHIIDRKVDLYPEQRKLYDEVWDDLKLTWADGTEEDIEYAFHKMLRCKQIIGTLLPFTGEDVSSKLDLAVTDDLEILAHGKKVVVFTQFRQTSNCYVDRMANHGVPLFELNGSIPIPHRMPVVRAWTATEGPSVIVCSLHVAREGVNLVAAQDASFLDKLFVPGLNQQAIDRLHRIGQDKKQPVTIRQYIARSTVDSRIEQILRTKLKLSKDIVDSNPTWRRSLIRAMFEDEDDEK